MADRFDLEEKIMRASWVLEDIRLLRDRYNQKDFTWDELDNFLMALETLYQHRFDDLDDMMCQVFELNEYAPDDKKQKREPVFEKGYPSYDAVNQQPFLSADEQEKVDNFYKDIEHDKKFKPNTDLQSTFDFKM